MSESHLYSGNGQNHLLSPLHQLGCLSTGAGAHLLSVKRRIQVGICYCSNGFILSCLRGRFQGRFCVRFCVRFPVRECAAIHLQSINPSNHGQKNGSISVYARKTDAVETVLYTFVIIHSVICKW
jgi:hypothetical protein